jgi:ABC-2 type transport system ATP-binding protein
MMQRVGVAAALMNDPDLILLDEPTDGVDPVGRRDIRDVLLRLKARGKTVFINSHLLSELEMICDRVAILVAGAVARQGTRDELAIGRGFFEIAFTPPHARVLPANWADGMIAGVRGAKANGELIQVETTDSAAIQPILDRLRGEHATIHRVQLVRPSLEDLFMEAVATPGSPTPGHGAAQ